MIPIEIKTVDELAPLLKTHTGSNLIVWNLRDLISGTPWQSLIYMAYARGNSTLVFRRHQNRSADLIEVFPKVTHSARRDGINYVGIQSVLPFLKVGATLEANYGHGFRLTLPSPLRELEIISFFKEGWDYYSEYTTPEAGWQAMSVTYQ